MHVTAIALGFLASLLGLPTAAVILWVASMIASDVNKSRGDTLVAVAIAVVGLVLAAMPVAGLVAAFRGHDKAGLVLAGISIVLSILLFLVLPGVIDAAGQ